MQGKQNFGFSIRGLDSGFPCQVHQTFRLSCDKSFVTQQIPVILDLVRMADPALWMLRVWRAVSVRLDSLDPTVKTVSGSTAQPFLCVVEFNRKKRVACGAPSTNLIVFTGACDSVVCDHTKKICVVTDMGVPECICPLGFSGDLCEKSKSRNC